MHTLFFMIGISGSGKSTIAKDFSARFDATIICPDDIRRELTGDVSNQTRNKEVFEIANERTRTLLKNKQSVIFDSTGSFKPGRDEIINIAKETGAIMIAVIAKDSSDITKCRNRVKSDIMLGIDRANTTEEHIHIRQHKSHMETINQIESEGWDLILNQ